MRGELEVVQTQCQIIEQQSKIIDGLFAHLSLLIAPEELACVPEIEQIKAVTDLKKGVDDT